MFDYNICPESNKKEFYNVCKKIESHFPELEKKELLEDVDSSLIQVYYYKGDKIKVMNDTDVDALYVVSSVDLSNIFN